MSTLHPTRIPISVTLHMNVSAGVHESGLETSQILSKANEVLYMSPNTICPTHSLSAQHTSKSQLQFNESQCRYQPTTTPISTVPTADVYYTTNKAEPGQRPLKIPLTVLRWVLEI